MVPHNGCRLIVVYTSSIQYCIYVKQFFYQARYATEQIKTINTMLYIFIPDKKDFSSLDLTFWVIYRSPKENLQVQREFFGGPGKFWEIPGQFLEVPREFLGFKRGYWRSQRCFRRLQEIFLGGPKRV